MRGNASQRTAGDRYNEGENYQSLNHLPSDFNLRRNVASTFDFFPIYIAHSSALRSLRAFAITETELNVMAAAAIMGLRSNPNTG